MFVEVEDFGRDQVLPAMIFKGIDHLSAFLAFGPERSSGGRILGEGARLAQSACRGLPKRQLIGFTGLF
jgi:hypothetical protein